MKRPTRARILRLGGLAVLLGCALVVFLNRPRKEETLEPVTILSGPFMLPVAPRDRFAITFRRGGRWAARAEDAFFGKRKPVDVSADLIPLSAAACTNLESTLNPGAPTFSQTNGLKLWFLSGGELKEIAQKISPTPGMEMLTHPRLVMADGIGGSMFMGQSVRVNGKFVEVGFSMRCAATFRDHSTELLTEIVQSEALAGRTVVVEDLVPIWTIVGVKTNLEVNARLDVPDGKGFLLVKWPGEKETNGWGVIVHPLR